MVLMDPLRRNDKSYTELVFYEKDLVKSDSFLDLVTALLTNTSVHTVRFHDCATPNWSSKQVKLLFSAIARLPNLQLLSIAGTTLPLSALAVVLSKGVSLQEMDVWKSNLVGSTQDANEWTNALKTRHELVPSQHTTLFLKQAKFDERLGKLDRILVPAMRYLDGLTLQDIEWKDRVSNNLFRGLLLSKISHLEIRDVQLSESHWDDLSKVLKSSFLVNLGVSDVNLSDQSIVSLASALSSNQNLKRLSLSRCGLTNTGVEHLALMLQTNTSLQTLDLSGNEMGDAGALALANTIHLSADTSSLKVLELYGNHQINKKGIDALLLLAEQSMTLESLHLFGTTRKRYLINDQYQLDVQRRINSILDWNKHPYLPGRRSRKRPKIWYE